MMNVVKGPIENKKFGSNSFNHTARKEFPVLLSSSVKNKKFKYLKTNFYAFFVGSPRTNF
ncbi:MAG TPA: hypothetical protein VE912_21210 [Bacteroidales bacterium]|nr:hypothetical protein [Bacteroidales bacterium]